MLFHPLCEKCVSQLREPSPALPGCAHSHLSSWNYMHQHKPHAALWLSVGQRGTDGATGPPGFSGQKGQKGAPGKSLLCQCKAKNSFNNREFFPKNVLELLYITLTYVLSTYLGTPGDVAYFQKTAIPGDRGPPGAPGERGPPGTSGQPGFEGPAGTHTHLL